MKCVEQALNLGCFGITTRGTTGSHLHCWNNHYPKQNFQVLTFLYPGKGMRFKSIFTLMTDGKKLNLKDVRFVTKSTKCISQQKSNKLCDVFQKSQYQFSTNTVKKLKFSINPLPPHSFKKKFKKCIYSCQIQTPKIRPILLKIQSRIE